MEKFVQSTEHVLHFLVQDTIACIDLKYIKQSILLSLLETIPNCPEYIIGLLNFNGKTIPVIDLTLRLNIHRTSNYSLNTPILICSNEQDQIGILVDKILGITALTPEMIQLQEQIHSQHADFLGTIIYDSRLSLLVNIKKILHNIFKTTKNKQLKTSSDQEEHIK